MAAKRIIIVKHFTSRLGPLLLGAMDGRLCLCDWRTTRAHSQKIDLRLQARLSAIYQDGTHKIIENAICQLEEYFTGRRTSLDVPLLLSGTDFQMQVWKELLEIPYGETISYSDLAWRIGRRAAVRAVANANNANPLSVFIPCHRVIGSNGKLTGYGGGLCVKQRLLELESLTKVILCGTTVI